MITLIVSCAAQFDVDVAVPDPATAYPWAVCGEGFMGWETPCCLDWHSHWQFGFCNGSEFIDLCLDFFFGRCRFCTTEFSCPSNAADEDVLICFQEEINRLRQDPGSPAQYDHIRRNLHLSDLALGHSCFWSPDNDLGYPGEYENDREILVASDLPFWLDKEYPNSGVCSELTHYYEYHFFGTCDQIREWLAQNATSKAVIQSGAFTGQIQTSFFGIGAYSTTDSIGPLAVTIIWVRTTPNPALVWN